MAGKSTHGSTKRRAALATVLLLGAAAVIICPTLGRPIWFDEAVTIMDFTLSPYSEIYTHYVIPNNHVLYTYILRLWLDTAGGLFPVSEVMFRLPSALMALLLAGLSFRLWRARMGFHAALVVTGCLVASTPFAIYGTAVRGYILSMVLVLCGLEAFLRWEAFGKTLWAAIFFLAALAGVATIPSNALAFCLLPLIPTPGSGKAFANITKNAQGRRDAATSAKRRAVAFALALATFALFYGPIWRQLLSALAHNNGWQYPWAACWHLAAGFVVFFIPVLAMAAPGALTIFRKPTAKAAVAMCAVIAAAPFLVTLARTPAPFPRVFLQMWPIWMYLAGRGAARSVALARKKGVGPWNLVGPALVLIVLIGLAARHWAPELSYASTSNGTQDDFFSPYYERTDFQPFGTVEKLLKLTNGKPKQAYLSQNADFPSIIFYGKLKGVQEDFWLCDFPGRKSIDAPDGKILVVVRNKADLNLLEKRFHLKIIRPVYTAGPQKIYLGITSRTPLPSGTSSF